MIINQPNMAVQEDLASLFAKNMTLAQQPTPPPPPPQEDDDSNRIVYISQHYTHSAHITHPQPQQQQAPQQEDEPMQRPSSEPPRSDLQDLELLLRSHGVNTSALSLPQVELFRNAGDPQKMRLIQLWTICPPTAGGLADNPTLTWTNTTVEQEEMLAQRRFEIQQQRQQEDEEEAGMGVPLTEVVMSLDGTETETTLGSSPASTSMQSADGSWPPPASSSSPHHHQNCHQHTMEPYMASGYEELARKEYDASARRADEYRAATDPVYESAGGGGMLDWERQQWMENRYGSIMAWRDDEEML